METTKTSHPICVDQDSESTTGRRDHFARWVFLKAMRRTQGAGLEINLPGGLVVFAGSREAELQARMNVHDDQVFRKVLAAGSIGLGESYMDGDWGTDDLASLLRVLGRNQEQYSVLVKGLDFVKRATNVGKHRKRSNHVNNSRENIAAHYDLSNEFYQTFLDEGMSYSSAVYDHPAQSLAEAQSNKVRRVLSLSGIQPGQTLLEIGTGWGELALTAAGEFGCRVVTITLSAEQANLARQRIRNAGLEEQIEVRLLDYRHLNLQADAVVSVEMIEAVGHEYLPEYFQQISNCLKPDGKAVLQAITIPENRYSRYTRSTDFIRKHIFPGGHLPSPEVIRTMSRDHGNLVIENTFCFGEDYARTLREWARRFSAADATVGALGFDERFRRKWGFYFSFCEAGFDERLIDVQHVVLRKNP